LGILEVASRGKGHFVIPNWDSRWIRGLSSKFLFVFLLLGFWFVPNTASAFNCTFTATINENSGANILWFGGSPSGNAADACLNFGFIHTTSGSSALGSWTSTGAGTDGGTQLPDNQITYTPAAGAVGTDSFSIVSDANVANDSTLAVTITIAAIPPSLSSVSPTSGSTSGGTSLTITGTALTGATGVTVGGTAATNVTVISDTTITATTPAGSAGTVDVRVTTAGGTSAVTANDHFTYIAPPTVSSVSPSGAPTAGGTTVTITGTNLTGATSVSFGATSATGFTVNGATSITATAPAHAAGQVDVTVTAGGITSAISAADHYTYVALPTATQAIASTTLTQNHAATSFIPVIGSGGTGSLSYGVSPSLPSGLSMAPATGAITGTPTVASSATTYTVTVTDANSATATATFSLTVNSAVTATQAIASTMLTQNHAATSFTPVTGSGGVTPLAYSVSPSLPTGLSMASGTGTITGTPTVTRSVTTYTVTVTDANSATATATFSLTVNGAVTATQAIPAALLTQNHAATSFTPVMGGGGTTPLAYGVSPSLPTGLSMAPATGAITGTPTVASSATTYTVTVTDANSATATATFSLTVNSAVTATQAVASTILTQNHAATSFTPVTGAGGTTPLAYTVSPSLPSGLNMAAATGAVTGTPTVASSATTYTVTVTDANSATATATFSLTVNGAVTATQAIASTMLTRNHAATSFTPVTGSGGTTPLAYTVSPGLPSGLNMAAATGAITGTPTVASSATTYTVTVTDANGQTATATFALTVNSVVTATQLIAATTLTVNAAATPFTPVTGSGGTTPLAYTVAPGLPTGLNMASATGAITGTPTVASSATTYTVTVTDANSVTATATFSLTVNGALTATQAVASTMLTRNHAATSFTPVTGSGGTGPLAYSVSPSLPTGLNMASGTGAITGTPGVASSATTYTVTVTDANNATATATFSLTVNGVVTATQVIASTTLTVNVAATPFTPVTGSGGTPPLAYSVSPGLPTGLSMAPATGAITGTPGVTSSVTTYTVTVTDANSVTATATFSLTVAAPTPVLAVAVSGSPASVVSGNDITYSIALTVTTGTATNASLSDPLPAGLTFVSASETGPGGAWTCTTPAVGGAGTVTCSIASAAPGTYNFTIVAHVAAGTAAGALVNTTTASASNATTTSGGATNTIALTTTSTTLVSSLNPSLVGQAVTFTATVSGSTPAGTVTFKDGATALGSGTLNGSGVATFTTAVLASGSHAVTASYGGDPNNASSTSSVLTQSVGQATTTVAVTSSVNPSVPGQPVTFTATVASAGGTPTGTVIFRDAGAAIGTGALAGGVATLATAALATGTHSITVSYSGATGFAASASSALTQTVAIPADSIKLRQLQVAVTKVVAQNSGQAITGAIDTAITDGFSAGGGLVTPSGTGLRFNFSADPDQPGAADHERAFSDRWNGMFDRDRTAGDGGANNYARNRQNPSAVDDAFAAINRNTMATKTPSLIGHEPKEWLLWADVRGSGVDRWGSTIGIGQSLLYGSQVNALIGVTRKVTPTFLVGIVGGYETFDYTSQDLSGKLKGNGWTIGSYLGWKLASSIRFDAAVAYSGIGYDGTAGTAQGNFDGRRWLLSSGLTGNYQAYGFDIEPSAKIYALWEHENAYSDSLGTHQDDRNFATGRASGGVKLSYPLAWTDTIALAPYIGLYGDYYFTHDDAATIVAVGALPLASTPLLDGWSARATAGFAARFASGAAISVGGELGGIGSDTRIWTYRARAAVPF
jgi:Bacterial Ig-like domain (group 3)/IPT/TIG domain/Putative Ig domain